MSKWVKHISNQGKKWEVRNERPNEWWQVEAKNGFLYLPASEYIICTPPERWVECTRGQIEIRDGEFTWKDPDFLSCQFRWAWKGDALIVERKEEE